MRIWGIVGRKDAGKTTLTEALVRILVARGLRVSTMKRTHHAVDLEVPGTDSHRHRAAGAGQVLLASDARLALMEETPAPVGFDALVARLAPCDVVLAEGWKHGTHDRIEVWRAACAGLPLAAEDPGIRAVATDAPVSVGCDVLDLGDVEAIAAYVTP